MNSSSDESFRILNAAGLFVFGAIIGFILIAWGGLATGAGHGTSFFYLLASSPGIYLLQVITDLPGAMFLPGLFWPIVFATLPWAQRKRVFFMILGSLCLHFAGIIYGLFARSALSGLEEMMEIVPGMIFCALLFYAGTHLAILLALRRAYRKGLVDHL